VRQNASFEIRIFDVHNSSSVGRVCEFRCALPEKGRSIHLTPGNRKTHDYVRRRR
jgi:hypothetical protein